MKKNERNGLPREINPNVVVMCMPRKRGSGWKMVVFWVRKDGQNCVFIFGFSMVTRKCRKKLLTFVRCVHSMAIIDYSAV